MLDLRAHAKRIVGQVRAAKPRAHVSRTSGAQARAYPPPTVEADDPFYRLGELAKTAEGAP